MTSGPALEACPFCGGAHPSTFSVGAVHFAKCWGCGASIPGPSESAVALAWNRRIAPRPATPTGRPRGRQAKALPERDDRGRLMPGQACPRHQVVDCLACIPRPSTTEGAAS